MITLLDIEDIRQKIAPLIGLQSWGGTLGYGSFITIEFGKTLPLSHEKEKLHGEWYLWIYCCAWFLEKNGGFLAGCEDERSDLATIIPQINGGILLSVEIIPPAFETKFRFDNGFILHTFPIYSTESKHWLLYTPDGNVLVIGPGSSWSYHRASQAL
jgi:hypothetical protein